MWRPLAEAIGERARTVAFDRRGWGRSGAPDPYLRTTIGEQSEDARAVLERAGGAPGVVCGAGVGAVIGLDLLIRRPDLVVGALLIEPPLLAFVPEATESLGKDRVALRNAVAEGGPEAGLELYLSGALAGLGPGAERIPDPLADRSHPLSLFAELAAVPSWPLPFASLAEVERPSRVVIGASTSPLVATAAEKLGARLGRAGLTRLGGAGLPQLDAPAELAEAVRELA